MAFAHGAHAVGLVSAMPSGPGVIDEDLIATIARQVPRTHESWLLTSHTRAGDIVAQHARCGTTTLQLVDTLDAWDEYDELRTHLPRVRLVQVVHVVDERAVEEANRIAPLVDAILLDSGNPSLAIKELGGTGRVHDWAVSRRVVESVKVPVFLAGGLRAENVAEAVAAVRPQGVDVCSGVRREGRLDRERLTAFVDALRG